MKKIVCTITVVLMIASVVYAQKKMAITAEDLAELKGTWEGVLSFGVFESGSSAAKLEILNDTAPVRARLTISRIPDRLAMDLGLMGGENVFESQDGTITTQGTIMFTGQQPKNFFEVSRSGEKKLRASYWFRMLKGDAIFTKK
ncbi:MAG TPA: hypothetical protein VEM15_13890 [Thermodesulfobacteriota bacterium]|nr:hypothetical protein [Thermodesulfobacteriota bacterium]